MARLVPRTVYPRIIEQLPYGPHTYKVVETLRMAVSGGLRDVAVVTDDWPQFTTILAQLTRPQFVEDSLGLYTTDAAKCRHFLSEDAGLDWRRYHVFGGVDYGLRDVLEGVAGEEGATVATNGPFHMLQIPPGFHVDSAAAPNDLTSGPLTAQDTDTVTSLWQYSEPGTEEFVQFIIDNFITVGVRDRGMLVGWYLQQPYGALGMLHVMDSHRGKGVGQYLVRELTRRILDAGKTPYLYVDAANVTSITLHQRCGYVITDSAKFAWIRTTGKLGKEAS